MGKFPGLPGVERSLSGPRTVTVLPDQRNYVQKETEVRLKAREVRCRWCVGVNLDLLVAGGNGLADAAEQNDQHGGRKRRMEKITW